MDRAEILRIKKKYIKRSMKICFSMYSLLYDIYDKLKFESITNRVDNLTSTKISQEF